MIGHGIVYGIALTCSCVFVTGTIFSPLKVVPSTLNIYKPGARSNDYEYGMTKRGTQDAQESPDSKERRSQMGSSFIRFGRSRVDGNLENNEYTGGNEIDSISGAGSSSASRIARGRSDIIIRFGRAEAKNSRVGQISGNDIKFLRYGNKPLEANDVDQLGVVCSNVLATSDVDGNQLGLYLPKLIRLCGTLGLGIDDNDDNRRRNKIIEFLEDAAQAESTKHE